MTPPDVSHQDVDAYALGVLDEVDAQRFEDHLATCDTCADELAALLPVVEALGHARPLAASAPSEAPETRPGTRAVPTPAVGPPLGSADTRGRRVLPAPVGGAPPLRSDRGDPRRRGDRRADRRRGSTRRLIGAVSMVAAVVALVMLAFGLSGWLGDGRPGGRPGSDARPTHPVPTGSSYRYSTTDPTSGVRLDASLDAEPWGTQVRVAVGNVTGPRSCRLLAVTGDGTVKEIATWRVPAAGYDAGGRSGPLAITAATDLERTDIRRIELRATEPGGGSTLLSSLAV